jgi:hypothetical protein
MLRGEMKCLVRIRRVHQAKTILAKKRDSQ